MPIENKFERVEDDDPNRCQALGGAGQCPFKAVQKDNGSYYNYCPRHLAGMRTVDERKKIRNYRLTKWQARMEEFADNEKVKSLREEIGIARILLEEIINACSDSQEIIMASNKISDLVTRIEKLVASCHKLEQSTGMLIDKATLLRLADIIVEIIGKYVEDDDAISAISFEIVKAIGNMSNESN